MWRQGINRYARRAMTELVTAWESLGTRTSVRGHELFVVDLPAMAGQEGPPILILHGFPSSSFDWRQVAPVLRDRRRVILIDMLGYGLSDKPKDRPYSLFDQADMVESVVTDLDIPAVFLVTHDMGDSVGGELLARSLDGGLPFDITGRVITNGSIYMDLVELSIGQQLMLALPDETLPPENAPNADIFNASLAATFSPGHQPSAEELEAQWELMSQDDGHRILPRLIRYVEERRSHEGRWTSAIEKHPSPLTIVWGVLDPIAVIAMATRLYQVRPDARFVPLDGIGHYPMIEAPGDVATAILSSL
jgi:pimeloyl-ACP methyl ester carboxylesterase